MPERIDLRDLYNRFEALHPRVARMKPGEELDPEDIREAIRISRVADAIRGRNPRHPLANYIGAWMAQQQLPTKWREDEHGRPTAGEIAESLSLARADALDRDTVLRLARIHHQDPAGFHEAVMGALAIEEAEYTPFMLVRVPCALWDDLRERVSEPASAPLRALVRALLESDVLKDGDA